MKKISINFICKHTNSSLFKGDAKEQISYVNSFSNANASDIVFVSKKNFINEANNSLSTTCLTSPQLAKDLSEFNNIIVSENPYLSFALLTNLFAKKFPKFIQNENHFKDSPTIGEGSLVSDSVTFGKNVKIGCNCVIEDNVSIGSNSIIDNNVVIYHSVQIGNNVRISSGSIIGSQGFGFAQDNETWVQINHLGSVVINDNVCIGSNTSIDRGTLDSTVIGKNVIIDNLVHIAHNVKVGNSTAIAAKVGIAGSTTIGQRCMIGGMVGIFGHLSISDDVIITPKSNVYRSIKKPGRYASLFPLLKFEGWKKISLLVSKLDKMAKFSRK